MKTFFKKCFVTQRKPMPLCFLNVSMTDLLRLVQNYTFPRCSRLTCNLISVTKESAKWNHGPARATTDQKSFFSQRFARLWHKGNDIRGYIHDVNHGNFNSSIRRLNSFTRKRHNGTLWTFWFTSFVFLQLTSTYSLLPRNESSFESGMRLSVPVGKIHQSPFLIHSVLHNIT